MRFHPVIFEAFEAEAARLLKAYGNGRKGKTKVK